MLSPTLEQTLHHALALANNRHHEYATLEHLLLALLKEEGCVAQKALKAVGLSYTDARNDILALTSS